MYTKTSLIWNIRQVCKSRYVCMHWRFEFCQFSFLRHSTAIVWDDKIRTLFKANVCLIGSNGRREIWEIFLQSPLQRTWNKQNDNSKRQHKGCINRSHYGRVKSIFACVHGCCKSKGRFWNTSTLFYNLWLKKIFSNLLLMLITGWLSFPNSFSIVRQFIFLNLRFLKPFLLQCCHFLFLDEKKVTKEKSRKEWAVSFISWFFFG